MHLLQRINGEAAQQFGVEVGGFLGHHGSGKGDFAELFHGDGIGKKGNVGFSALHLVDGFASIAQITKVGLLADLFSVEAKKLVEDDRVQVAQVELALVFGNAKPKQLRRLRVWNGAGRRRSGRRQ